jgi:hypothetical protein
MASRKNIPQPQVYIDRWTTGLVSLRSPLVSPFSYSGTSIIEKKDALIDGNNIDISPTFTLQRRPGFPKYCSQTLDGAPLGFYKFSKLDGTIILLTDTATSVYVYTTTTATIIYTKTSAAPMQYRSIGSTLYMYNGTDSIRYDGTTITGNGISTPVTGITINLVSGSLSASSGYVYGYAFKDSVSGHNGTLSIISSNTGKLSSQNVQLSGSRSANARVDTIQIYRNLDGGSQLGLLTEIANPPSGTWTFTDSGSLSPNLLIPAPVDHINDPPPTGADDPVFHAGRLWLSVDNKVYFNAGGDSLTGVPEECWPPANVFVFPSKITAKKSTTQGLIVTTASDMYIIPGYDLSSFYSKLFMPNFGVLNPRCMAQDGDLLFMYTTSRQIIAIASTLDNAGFVVSDQFQTSFPPNSCSLAMHRSGYDSGLFLSNGAGTILRYSLDTESWSTPYTVVNGTTIASIEATLGSYRLFLGSSVGHILSRDITAFNDDGSTYTGYGTIGPLVMDVPGEQAQLTSVWFDRTAVGGEIAVDVLTDEISGTFVNLPYPVAEPWDENPSSTILPKRWDIRNNQQGMNTHIRLLQVKFRIPAEDAKHEILSLAVR